MKLRHFIADLIACIALLALFVVLFVAGGVL